MSNMITYASLWRKPPVKITRCYWRSHPTSVLEKMWDNSTRSSTPDIAHQLNLQSATQSSGEPLKEWAENMLTLATRAFPTLPYVIPKHCYSCIIEERTVLQVFMLWRSRPKLSPKTAFVDQMLYFQHSRRSCPSKPKERQVG